MDTQKRKEKKTGKVEVRLFLRADLHARIKEYVRPYGGATTDFIRRACLHELERQGAGPQQ